MRRSLQLMFAALTLAACGGSGAARPPPAAAEPEPPSARVRLRVQAPVGARYSSVTSVAFRASILTAPIDMRIKSRGEREVLEVRAADGALLLEDTTTSTVTETHHDGGQPPTQSVDEPEPPSRSWMSPRGHASPVEEENEEALEGLSLESREQIRGLLERMVQGFDYPQEEIEPGHEWGSASSVSLSEAGPELDGAIRYDVRQRYERLDASGLEPVAVITFEMTIEGEAELDGASGDATQPPGATAPPDPQDPAGLSGALGRLRGQVVASGTYEVAIDDGFVRSLELELEGELELMVLQVPVEGTIRYAATRQPE